MKKIQTDNNYIQLIDDENNSSLGFEVGSITYKINGNNISFYLAEDYFYKNSIFTVNIPTQIDDQIYDVDNVGDGLAAIFNLKGNSGKVNSVNGQIGDVWITANDLNVYQKNEVYNKTEVDNKISNVTGDITNITQELTTIEGDITNIENSIENIFNDIESIDEDITNIYSELENKLEADNIKQGANITLNKVGNDITISATGLLSSVSWGQIAGDLQDQTDLNNALNNKADSSAVTQLRTDVDTNTSDIEDLRTQINNTENFRGYWATNAEVLAIQTPVGGNYAYSAESGTEWVYNTSWSDTGRAIPDQVIPKTTTVPLMNGVASIGSENSYSAGNHIHPTDTTRASNTEFQNYKTDVTNALDLKADKSNTYTKSEVYNKTEIDSSLANKVDNTTLNNYYNKTQVDNLINEIEDDLADYYTKLEIDDMFDNIDLSNYYTKTQTDTLLAAKQNKLTSVTDIQLVDSLPASPVATVLYLLPV